MQYRYLYLVLLVLTGCVSVKPYYSTPTAQAVRRDSLAVLAADTEQEEILGYLMKGDTVYAAQYRDNAFSGKQEWLIRFKGRFGYVDRTGFSETWDPYSYSRYTTEKPSVRGADQPRITYFYDPELYIVTDSLVAVVDAQDTLGMLRYRDTIGVWERWYTPAGNRISYMTDYRGRPVHLSGISLMLLRDYDYQMRYGNRTTTTSERSGTSSSGTEHTWQTGQRGGKYYINSKGNKVYKKK